MKKIFLVMFLILAAAGIKDCYGSGSLSSKVDQKACTYQMNFCQPYNVCLNTAQGGAWGTQAFKTCAEAFVKQCAVTKIDGSGKACTEQDGTNAWGNLWK